MVVDGETDTGGATRGASVLVLARDSVLMVERAQPPFKGVWSFPGGRSEQGESPEETARRELLEETGLKVGRVVLLGESHPMPDRPAFRLTVFAARAGGGAPVAADDAFAAVFVPLAAVQERPTTKGAAGWIARAIAALADLPPT